MKRTIGAVVVALLAACGGDKEEAIEYGAPQPPTATEQAAADAAQTTLSDSLTFSPSTQPSFGAMALADELAAYLGAEVASLGRSAGSASTALRAAGGASTALDTTGIDPACVSTTPTSATWTDCVITVTDFDPTTGDGMEMTATVNGSASWDPVSGQTVWNVDETMSMTMTQGGSTTMTEYVVAGLDGAITVTPTTIVGNTSTDVGVTGNVMGIPVDEAFRTTLALDLGYQTDPTFCITSGSLVLEQRWTQRPIGATPEMLPDQGWRFEWTGCDQYQVAHGS